MHCVHCGSRPHWACDAVRCTPAATCAFSLAGAMAKVADENVRVFVRVRPPLPRELGAGDAVHVHGTEVRGLKPRIVHDAVVAH